MSEHQSVCLLNDSFPPLIDGVANTVVNYARHITEAGDQALVLTPYHPNSADGDFPYPVVRYPGIDLRALTGYVAGVPFSPEVADAVETAGVTLYHSHCPFASNILARQLRSVVHAPIIMTYHTKFDIEIERLIHRKLLQEGSKRVLVKNISACDEVWVVSRGAGENLVSLGYEGAYVVMPNGVDLERGLSTAQQVAAATDGYDLPAGLPVYLFVGRMRWYKNQRMILDALSNMAAEGLDFRMVFIGKGEDLEEIRAYAADCGLEKQCIFTGAIMDREVLRAWYTRADLFLFPSTFDTNGLVVREAAACSLASVLIADSCAAEGITDGRNGFLIEEDALSLYDCLKKLHGSPEQMHNAGALASAEIYISWKEAVTLARERYEIVIDRYRCGAYIRPREPVDLLLKANGELMEDMGHLLRLKNELKQTALDRLNELWPYEMWL